MPLLSDLARGARNLAVMAGLAQPDAMSRVTHTPIYLYRDDATGEAGYTPNHSDSIFLNRVYEDDPEAFGALTRHESTHQILKPYMSDLAADPELAKYVGRVQAGLVKEKSPIYTGATPPVAISEALAYGTYDPNMPGLTPDDSRALLSRAMTLVDAKDPRTGKQLRRLYSNSKLSDLLVASK